MITIGLTAIPVELKSKSEVDEHQVGPPAICHTYPVLNHDGEL